MATSIPPLTPIKPPGSAFPQKVALAALTATALLYGWHRLKDPSAGLAPGIFRQAAELHVPHAPSSVSPTEPLNGSQQPDAQTSTAKPGTPASISPVLIDESRALDPFFAALYNLESRGKPELVTILHYGDSPTTADLITGDARAMLQGRFGDAGPGFNLIGKPWAWYGHRGVAISDHDWKPLTGVGSIRQSTYGLGGVTFVGGPTSASTFRFADHNLTSAELQYLTQPGGGIVTLSSNDAPLATIPTDGPADTPAAHRVDLPPGTSSLRLTVSGGPVRLFGLDLRKGNSGVLYDSLGLNGASTTVLSRTFSPAAWSTELRHTRPSLVIINYGTNESTFAAFVHKQYEGELRLAIQKLRNALPDVPILIMAPMDRGERGGLNEIHTMATIPEIVALQQRVAVDTHCAFFDTFNAMGGDGTMARWTTAKPRLVTADLIHPTPQGALIVAQQLITNLSLGYDHWKQTHGHSSDHSDPTPSNVQAHPSTVIPTGATQTGGTRFSPAASQAAGEAVISTGAQRSGETPALVLLQPPRQKPSAALPATSADPSNSSDTEDDDF